MVECSSASEPGDLLLTFSVSVRVRSVSKTELSRSSTASSARLISSMSRTSPCFMASTSGPSAHSNGSAATRAASARSPRASATQRARLRVASCASRLKAVEGCTSASSSPRSSRQARSIRRATSRAPRSPEPQPKTSRRSPTHAADAAEQSAALLSRAVAAPTARAIALGRLRDGR